MHLSALHKLIAISVVVKIPNSVEYNTIPNTIMKLYNFDGLDFCNIILGNIHGGI